jgi:UDP-3-O-[3-hydroxymyristoyl] glucosamine N-acyltransferase
VRFRGGVSLAEALEACGSLLKAPLPPGAPALSGRLPSLDDPEFSGPASLTVVGRGVRLEIRNRLRAAVVFAEEGVDGLPESVPVIRVADARSAVALLIRTLAPGIEYEKPFGTGEGNSVHPSAVVEGILEGGVSVGAGAYVGPGTFIGKGSVLEPRAVVLQHCLLGRDCVVQSGAVIGSAGFGFLEGDGAEAVPHLSGVVVGGKCFMGANTVVAAGVLHPTEIGEGCRLDSHVQIAHNVRLGKNCRMASQSGIAGSTVVGDSLRMGGAASVAGHLRIGNNVSVAAKSGVTKDVADGMTVAGFPARPIGEWRRQQIYLKNRIAKWFDE